MFEKEDFKKKVLEYIQKNYPNLIPKLRDDFGIDVEISQGKVHSLGLDNVYKAAYEKNFQGWEFMIDSLLKLKDPLVIRKFTWDEIKDRIFPQVKNAGFIVGADSKIQENNQKLLTYWLNNDLGICWVIDLPDTMIYATISNLEDWKVTREELVNTSLTNLAKLSGTDAGLHIRKFDDGVVVIYSQAKDGYDASRILLLQRTSVYNNFASYLGENFVVGIPHRDLLVAISQKNVSVFEKNILDEYLKSPYNISPKLFTATPNGISVFKE